MYGIAIYSENKEYAYLIGCNDDGDGEGMYNMLQAMSTIDSGFYYQNKKNWNINQTWEWIANQFDVEILEETDGDHIRGLYLTDELDDVMHFTDYNALVGPDQYIIYSNNTIEGFDEYYNESCKVYDMPDSIYESWNFDGDIELNEEQFYDFMDEFEEKYMWSPGRLYIRHGDEKYTMYFPEGKIY